MWNLYQRQTRINTIFHINIERRRIGNLNWAQYLCKNVLYYINGDRGECSPNLLLGVQKNQNVTLSPPRHKTEGSLNYFGQRICPSYLRKRFCITYIKKIGPKFHLYRTFRPSYTDIYLQILKKKKTLKRCS